MGEVWSQSPQLTRSSEQVSSGAVDGKPADGPSTEGREKGRHRREDPPVFLVYRDGHAHFPRREAGEGKGSIALNADQLRRCESRSSRHWMSGIPRSWKSPTAGDGGCASDRAVSHSNKAGWVTGELLSRKEGL